MIRSAAVAVAAAAVVVAACSSAQGVVLYDGALNTSPQDQGMTYVPLGVATATTANGATTLDTSTATTTYAGFGRTALPLDRAAGFSVRLDARLVSESLLSSDRAALSLLVITSDLRAIELGFQTGRVFAQADDPLFTAAEATAGFAPTASHRYDLDVLGNAYTLRADGALILSGALRDYTAFPGLTVGPFTLDPYETPNSLFVGDNSTRAGGVASFSYLAVTVPEPTTLATIAGLAIVAGWRRRVV